MKIYLAGPDIFRPDAQDWIANAREICRHVGLPLNLMLALSAKIIEGDLAACIAAIRPRTVAASAGSQKAECL